MAIYRLVPSFPVPAFTVLAFTVSAFTVPFFTAPASTVLASTVPSYFIRPHICEDEIRIGSNIMTFIKRTRGRRVEVSNSLVLSHVVFFYKCLDTYDVSRRIMSYDKCLHTYSGSRQMAQDKWLKTNGSRQMSPDIWWLKTHSGPRHSVPVLEHGEPYLERGKPDLRFWGSQNWSLGGARPEPLWRRLRLVG